MKKIYTCLSLISVIFLISIIGLFSEYNLASSDIDYTFKNDNLYNVTNPIYVDSFNLRNKTEYLVTDIYNATYSFTQDDTTPTDWVLIENGGTIIVIDTFEGHNKVVQIEDTNGAGYNILEGTMMSETSGTVEFWIYATDSDKTYNVWISDGGGQTNGISLFIDAVKLYYYDGSSHIITDFASNIWYHIRVDFRFSGGVYLGLALDTFRVYLNGIQYGDYNARGTPTTLNSLEFTTGTADSGYLMYLDAIGYSWDDNYNIGDNMIPYYTLNISNVMEVDKWEFSYDDFPTHYAVNSDVFSDWTEDDNGDHINIAMDYNALDGNPSYFPDRQIKIHDHIGSGANIGIERDFDVLDGLVNVTWSYNITTIDPVSVSEITTEIYSSDDTLLFQIYLEMGNIEYKDGGDNVLESGIIQDGEIYDFNFFFKPSGDGGILRFNIDGVFHDRYFIPNLDSSKNGLGKIKFKTYHDPPRELIFYLDNVGVYSNGTSISTEPSFRQISLDDVLFHQNWWFTEYSTISLNLEGLIGLYLTDWYFYIGYGNIEVLLSTREFDGTTKTFNIYDNTHDGNHYIYSPQLWIEFYDEFQVSSIEINGVFMTDGAYNYNLDFSYGNINTSESYFYVNDNNYLSWNLVMNDTNTEFIQANFDLIDSGGLYDDDYSMYLYGYENNNGNGYYGVNYQDSTSTSFMIPIKLSTVNNYLNTQKKVTEIVILITDNDNYNVGVNTGQIREIQFRYVSGADLSLATLSLTKIMLNLVVILVPSLLFWYAFDKKRDVLLISMALMLIVSIASSLIPIWFFFLGLMCIGMFFFIKTDEGSF